MPFTRRHWIGTTAAASLGLVTRTSGQPAAAELPADLKKALRDLKITGLRVTPIALPDPPLLSSFGAHGPYFLRTVVELETSAGLVGIGESRGSDAIVRDLEGARDWLIGDSPFNYRSFQRRLAKGQAASYPALELACLDVIGRAAGKRLCDLLGGPAREQVEFAGYLFYRYAADHPQVFADKRLIDNRGKGEKALDHWGEVLTPEAMGELAVKFRDKWGFKCFKLKGGLLDPDVELASLKAINARLGGNSPLRIDPNARWSVATSLRIAKDLHNLPLEYYEDPVEGQAAMAEVGQKTGLKMSTNMCITRFTDVPSAVRLNPVQFILVDHHTWAGIPNCQALGTLAEPMDWTLSQHSNNHAGITMAAMIHVGALIPRLTSASDSHYPWLPDDADIIVGPKLAIKNGMMEVPKGPGLGVELDRVKLAKAHETYVKSGMRGRNDAETMQRFQPGWKPGNW